MQEIAETITGEVGMPMVFSQMIQAGLPAMVMGSYVDIANQFPFEEQIGNSLVVREPFGVVGCITPWNYPLHQTVAKVAPALAAGCTVVLKPSEVAPLNAFILAEIVDDVGLPGGRVQPRHRRRAPSWARRSPPIPTSTWCRSPAPPVPASGWRSSPPRPVKKVTLELGGKSPFIILPGRARRGRGEGRASAAAS